MGQRLTAQTEIISVFIRKRNRKGKKEEILLLVFPPFFSGLGWEGALVVRFSAVLFCFFRYIVLHRGRAGRLGFCFAGWTGREN